MAMLTNCSPYQFEPFDKEKLNNSLDVFYVQISFLKIKLWFLLFVVDYSTSSCCWAAWKCCLSVSEDRHWQGRHGPNSQQTKKYCVSTIQYIECWECCSYYSSYNSYYYFSLLRFYPIPPPLPVLLTDEPALLTDSWATCHLRGPQTVGPPATWEAPRQLGHLPPERPKIRWCHTWK